MTSQEQEELLIQEREMRIAYLVEVIDGLRKDQPSGIGSEWRRNELIKILAEGPTGTTDSLISVTPRMYTLTQTNLPQPFGGRAGQMDTVEMFASQLPEQIPMKHPQTKQVFGTISRLHLMLGIVGASDFIVESQIGGLEAEVQRLTQENAQTRHDLAQRKLLEQQEQEQQGQEQPEPVDQEESNENPAG
jgi:hypothetical protein